ncbi:MAG: M23 family metallopeptidase [Alphaproteobacteria bacterium]
MCNHFFYFISSKTLRLIAFSCLLFTACAVQTGAPLFEEKALENAIFKEETNSECRDGFECRVVRKDITIQNGSIYKSSIRAGVPDPVVINMMRLYRHDYSLKKQVKNGDQLTILYQEYYDEHAKRVRANSLVYANLPIDGKPVAIYRHNITENQTDYYYADGKLVSCDPLPDFKKIVVKHARITSGFGLRDHPLRRGKRVHRGVDLAAPYGYRVYAPADGKVVFRGRKRGYGYYIRLKHNTKYSTAYAHLSRYHSRVKRGAKIKKGQVIGYVGKSGRVTGAHLHYEIIRNSRQVDPLIEIVSSPEKLESDALARFEENVDYIQDIAVQLQKPVTPVISPLAKGEKDEKDV